MHNAFPTWLSSICSRRILCCCVVSTLFLSPLSPLSVPSARASNKSSSLEKRLTAEDLARIPELARSEEWIRLGHYEKGKTNSFVSRVDNPEFFLSPIGSKDPQSELISTLDAFFNESEGRHKKIGPAQLSPHCAFPARRAFLAKELPTLTWLNSSVNCEDLTAWKKGLSAQSISLVFSSSFSGSPGSMFGHTFLKFNRRALSLEQSPSAEHLTPPISSEEFGDYSLSFAAMTANANPIKYLFYGVFGGFPGIFSLEPFYLKIRDYNNAEGRDLWVYDLNLNETQVDFMLSHIWELMNLAVFDYYFFNENCASLLLKIIEVADPKLKLVDGYQFAILPSETIKTVAKVPNMIVHVRSKGALKGELDTLLETISTEERSEFDSAIEHQHLPQRPLSRKTLLGLALYVEWNRLKAKGEISTELEQLKKSSLVALSQIPVDKHKPESELRQATATSAQSNPAKGHSPNKVTLGQRRDWKVGENTSLLSYRYGFHDPLDPSLGYEKGLEIEYLKTQLGISHNGKLSSAEVVPLRMKSLSHYDSLAKQISYSAHFSYSWRAEQSLAKAEFGVGLSRHLSKTVWSALVLPTLRYQESYKGPAFLALPLNLGLQAELFLGGRLDTNLKIDAWEGASAVFRSQFPVGFWKSDAPPSTFLSNEVSFQSGWDGNRNWAAEISFGVLF